MASEAWSAKDLTVVSFQKKAPKAELCLHSGANIVAIDRLCVDCRAHQASVFASSLAGAVFSSLTLAVLPMPYLRMKRSTRPSVSRIF